MNSLRATQNGFTRHHKKEKTYLVDFEGYGSNIIKEIGFYNFQTKSLQHFFIKTMLPKDTKTYKWLLNHYHYIPYNLGNTSFRHIINKLNQPHAIFYIKGAEKKRFLKKFTKNQIINIENFNCPSLKLLKEPELHFCFFHLSKPSQHCVIRKIYNILNWLNEQKLDFAT